MEGSSTGADAATVTRWFQIADPFGTYIGLAGCSARLGVWTVYGQDNGKPLVSGRCLASWQGGLTVSLWTAASSLPKSVSVGYGAPSISTGPAGTLLSRVRGDQTPSKAPSTIWRPDSVRAPKAIPPARTSRRLRRGAVMALWKAGGLIELSRIRRPVARSSEAISRSRRIRRVKSFEYSSLEFAVSTNGLRKQQDHTDKAPDPCPRPRALSTGVAGFMKHEAFLLNG
jgi:hypothetical protein